MNQLTPLQQVPAAEDIAATHRAIAGMIHRTPVLTSASIDELTGAHIFFKCENFQKIGAFKMRGAASAAVRLSPEQQQRGLATHSSGNHAQAVARAARSLGIPAYIVMPENAPAVKVAATRSYGARITFCESTPEAREATLEKVVAETGAHFIHPYDNYDVICGQATAARELIEDVEQPLDLLLAPVGGGGLLAGTALAARYFSPGTTVLAAEPERVNDAFRGFHSGRIEQNASTDTIADGLRTPVGQRNFELIRRHVQDILTVSEEDIVAAMRLIWERMKIIVEPSCAVPLAAVMRYPDRFRGKRTGIILTGGNVDLARLPFTE